MLVPPSRVPLAAGPASLLLAPGCAGLSAGRAADARRFERRADGALLLRTEDRRSILARRMHP